MILLRNLWSWLAESFRGFFRGDVRAILICIGASAIIWVLNAMSLEHEAFISYSVAFEDENNAPIPQQDSLQQLRIKVQGKGWNILRELNDSKQKQIRYRVNRQSNAKYILANALRANLNTEIPNTLKLLEIQADTFFVDYEEQTSKRVKLVLNQEKININSSFQITSELQINPQYLVVVGNFERIRKVPDSLTLPIPEHNISKNYNKTVDVSALFDSSLAVIPPQVQVQFRVERFVTKVMNIPIEKLNFNPKQELSAKEAEIAYSCRAADQASINVEDFKVFADAAKMNPEDSSITLIIERMPAKVRDVKINNATLKIIFRE